MPTPIPINGSGALLKRRMDKGLSLAWDNSLIACCSLYPVTFIAFDPS